MKLSFSTILSILKDNRGDENVAKLIWIVAVLALGGLLIGTADDIFKAARGGLLDRVHDIFAGNVE